MARPFADSPAWRVIDWLGDRTALPESWIIPLACLQWGWGTVERPHLGNLRILGGPASNTVSLYMNGLVFARVALPFFVSIMIRWGGKDCRRAFLQLHLGWKLNGRLAVVFRVQGDESAAGGMDFPNVGQAQGFADGGK